MLRFTSVAVLASTVFTLACSDEQSNPNQPEPTGTYKAQVTGQLSRSAEGTASMVIDKVSVGGPRVALVLGAAAASDRISLMISGDRPPANGDYEVELNGEPIAGKWIASYLVTAGGQTVGNFKATGGLVRISYSSANRVRGLFAIDAEGTWNGPGSAPVQIVVEGTFDAPLTRQQ